MAAIQAALNSNLPPAARPFLTHWLTRLEKQAANAHCTIPTGPSADVLPVSTPAQAVPMPVAPAFPIWFGLWL